MSYLVFQHDSKVNLFRYDKLFDFAHADLLCVIDDIRRSKNCKPNDILDLTVSLDGTWKKRGHQSMYCIVFLIEAESGYCLDFEILSKRCELCEAKQRTLSTTQFKKWVSEQALLFNNISSLF